MDETKSVDWEDQERGGGGEDGKDMSQEGEK